MASTSCISIVAGWPSVGRLGNILGGGGGGGGRGIITVYLIRGPGNSLISNDSVFSANMASTSCISIVAGWPSVGRLGNILGGGGGGVS